MHVAVDDHDARESRLTPWRTLLSQSSSLRDAEIDDQYVLDCVDALYNKLFSARTLAFITDIEHGTSDQNRIPDLIANSTTATIGQGTVSSVPVTTRCDTQDGLRIRLDQRLPMLRLISIVRGNSLQPFRISSDAIIQIIQRHQIARPFLDLLFGFRNQSELSEKGCSVWCASSTQGQSLLCYQLRYRERNFRTAGSEEWSERQVGVYHDFSADVEKPSTMILLHAKEKTLARTRLEEVLESNRSEACHTVASLQLHLILLSSYVDNWRWYLDDLGRDILAEENKGVTDDLTNPYAISFPTLQKLRDREADLTTAAIVLDSTNTVIETIKAMALTLPHEHKNSCSTSKTVQSFERILLRCQGYRSGVKVLSERVSKLIQLVADGLNHKNQINNAKISESLYKLTKKSVDDNAVIRVVTIITLIYLPTQFVATFFGMNFTDFDNSSLIFANNWWWFLAAAIPLTILTLAAVGTAMLVERNKRLGKPPLSLATLLQRQDSASSLLPVDIKGE